MKKPLISFGLFLLAQAAASVGAIGYLLATGAGPGLTADALAVPASIALLATNAALIAVFVALGYVGRPRRGLPAPSFWRNTAVATGALLLLAVAESMLLEPLGLDDDATERMFTLIAASPLGLLSICLVGPVAEEFVFRAGVVGGLTESGRIPPALAVAVSALAFSAVHANWMQAVPAFFSGLLLGWLYLRTRSVAVTSVAHVANNTVAVLSQFHPDAETWLTSLPLPLLLLGGALLAALGVLLGTLTVAQKIHPRNR
ncbi:MAG: CPBP family intramembrane metalloprotease [Bacteroidaceae bacterium]|nr:CPBP family intramembrane metalloprotease [Bacteroidaceae bacterium]